MPLSRLDLPAVRDAVTDLYRVLEGPTPSNRVACRLFRWSTARSTLGEQSPEGLQPVAFVAAAVEWVIFHFGDHSRRDCPEIAESPLDLDAKAALLALRAELMPPGLSLDLANDAGLRVRFLAYLGGVLDRLGSAARAEQREDEGGTPTPNRSRGVPRAEAEIRVRDWLANNAKDDPHSVTVRKISKAVGVSTGLIVKTSAWVVFETERKESRSGSPRTVPLSDDILAAVGQEDPQLSKYISEQEADLADDERRSRPRSRRRS